MQSAELTPRIRYAKVGDVIIVPMGMIFPHAVKIEAIRVDDEGQICGDGHVVEAQGCSTWRMGSAISVCLGWKAI